MYQSMADKLLELAFTTDNKSMNIDKNLCLRENNYHKSSKKKHLNRKKVMIGVSIPTLREARWVRDKEAMEAYAKERGVNIKIENAEYDAVKQVSQVENLISQGIDALIILPLDRLAYKDIVEKAHELGIKVISYEVPIQNSDIDIFVAFNSLRVGELQGRYLIENAPRGNYIIMYAVPDSVFKEGAMEYIQPLVDVGNVKVIADKPILNWDPRIAYNVVKDALIANSNNVNAILAPNDAIAGAAIEALQEKGLAGKVAVTGQDADLDAIRRILQGTQLMTVFKDSKRLAKTALDTALKLINGEPINIYTKVNNGKKNVDTILVEPIAIDKSNIESVLVKSGYYKEKDINMRKRR